MRFSLSESKNRSDWMANKFADNVLKKQNQPEKKSKTERSAATNHQQKCHPHETKKSKNNWKKKSKNQKQKDPFCKPALDVEFL